MLAHSEIQLTHPAFREKASTTETTRCACTSGASSSCNASLRRPPFAKHSQRPKGRYLELPRDSSELPGRICTGIKKNLCRHFKARETLPFYLSMPVISRNDGETSPEVLNPGDAGPKSHVAHEDCRVQCTVTKREAEDTERVRFMMVTPETYAELLAAIGLPSFQKALTSKNQPVTSHYSSCQACQTA